MDIPSYWYAALDNDTKELVAELDELGGGDAIATPLELHCVVDDERSRDQSQTLWRLDSSVGLKDMVLSNSHYVPRSTMKYYPVTKCHVVHDLLRDASHFTETKSIVKTLLDGFNICLVSYGERGVGKSAVLFGVPPTATSRNGIFPNNRNSISDSLITQLFRQSRLQDGITTIAISAWTIKGNQVTDLLTPSVSSESGALEFTMIECPTEDIARSVIDAARARAPGAEWAPEGSFDDIDRCHFFLRIVIHRQPNSQKASLSESVACQGSLSHIHIVDLVGTAPVDDRQFNQMTEENKIARRNSQLQLLSFSKVLREMVAVSKSTIVERDRDDPFRLSHDKLASREVALTSARDSLLTSILGPILQGNCKTILMAFVRDGESHYSATKSTLQCLEGTTQIMCAAHKVHGISLWALKLVDHHHAIRDSDELILNRRQDTEQLIRPQIIPTPPSPSHDGNTSLDEEGLDLDRVLKGDIYKKPKRVPVPQTHISAPSQSQDHLARDSSTGIAQTNRRGALDSIMGEFHDLMAEMKAQESTVKEAVQQIQTRTEDMEMAAFLKPSERRYLGPPSRNSGNTTFPPPSNVQRGGLEVSDDLCNNDSLDSDSRQDTEGTEYTAERLLEALEAMKSSETPGTPARQLLDDEIERVLLGKMVVINDELEKYLTSQSVASGQREKEVDPESSSHVANDSGSYMRAFFNNLDQNHPENDPFDKRHAHSSSSLVSRSDGKTNDFSRVKINDDRDDMSDDSLSKEDEVVVEEVGSDMQTFFTKFQTDAAAGIGRPRQDSINISEHNDRIMVSARASEQASLPLSDIPPEVLQSFTGIGAGLPPTAQVMSRIYSISPTNRSIEEFNDLEQSGTAPVRKAGDNVVRDSEISGLHAQFTGSSSLPTSGTERMTSLRPVESHSPRSQPHMKSNDTNSVQSQDVELLVQELAQSQQSIETLLDALNEERHHRQRIESKLQHAQEEVVEIRTQCEVEVDSYKLEAIKMKSQIRTLCAEHSISDVYTTFEDNVARLVKENEALRTRNLFLEAKDLGIIDSNGQSSVRASKDGSLQRTFGGTSDAPMHEDWEANEFVEQDGDDQVNASLDRGFLSGVNDKKVGRLAQRLKKLMQEKEELKRSNEELLKKERVQLVTAKLADDAKRRMHKLYTDNQKLTVELNNTKQALFSVERDLNIITDDAKEVRASEQHLREERAKTLAELGHLRERIRDLDNERKRYAQINRFIAKHSKFPTADSSIEAILGEKSGHAVGQAGLVDAQYVRVEEQDVLSEGLESILSALHDSMVDNCPKMLPLLRRLTAEIHNERAALLVERSKLLGMVYKMPEKSPIGNRGRSGSRNRVTPTFNPQSQPAPVGSPSSFDKKAAAHIRNQRPTTVSQQQRQYQLQHQQQVHFDGTNGTSSSSQNRSSPSYMVGNGAGIQFSYGPRDAKYT